MNDIRPYVASEEQQLFSKQAIQLPPVERLELLLKAKSYPMVRKKTSAKKQIKEMLDLYDLYCLMLVQFFPNEGAEEQCLLLTLMTTQEISQTAVNDKLSKAFRMLSSYENLERRITAIQTLFDKYREVFPDIYERYNLEEIAVARISDIIRNSRQLCQANPLWSKEVMNRWELS